MNNILDENQDIKLRFELPPYSEDYAGFLQFDEDELYSGTKSKKRFFYESRVRRILNLILESNLPKNAKILDLGCSVGNISLSLIYHGFDVYSVDLMSKKLGWFNTKAKFNDLNSYPIVANACNLPFHDCFFDCVIATEIIEHLYEPSVFIEEIKKVLKDDGIIILSTPNRNSINFSKFPKYTSIKHTNLKNLRSPAELWFERERPGYTGAHHVFEFSKSELIDFLKEHELEIDVITKSTNKILANIGIKLSFDYYKLLKVDENYENSLFSNLFYSNFIVKCFKRIDKNDY